MLIEKKINRKLLGLLISLLWLCSTKLFAGEVLARIEQELSSLIETVKPSVVSITSTISHTYHLPAETTTIPFWGSKSEQTQSVKIKSISSGLIIDKNGYIITKSHVVPEAEKIEVLLFNEEKFDAVFIGFDFDTGIAVIKIEEQNLMPAKFGSPVDISVGKWVAIMGNSVGVTSSISLGMINGIRDNNLIQLSAFINPGNSGSPIFNIDGEVIGIVAARLNTNDISFGSSCGSQSISGGIAYPIDMIHSITQKLIFNHPQKQAWFGITTQDVDSLNGFVKICAINHESPAQKAGLKLNDLLLKVNDILIHNSYDLIRIWEQTKPGSTLDLTVRRENEDLKFSVTLIERPQNLTPRISSKQYTESIFSSSSISFQTPEYIPKWQYTKDIETLNSRVKLLENEIEQLKSKFSK